MEGVVTSLKQMGSERENPPASVGFNNNKNRFRKATKQQFWASPVSPMIYPKALLKLCIY
jgi:hypothetical protein